jgi:hypothetical protein
MAKHPPLHIRVTEGAPGPISESTLVVQVFGLGREDAGVHVGWADDPECCIEIPPSAVLPLTRELLRALIAEGKVQLKLEAAK